MMTNLKAELPGYGMVCAEFWQYSQTVPIQYLQKLDTFQVQLCDQINIFGCKQVDNLYVSEGNQPREGSQQAPYPKRTFPK